MTIGHGVLPRVPGCVPWLPLSEVVPRRPARRQLVEVVGAGVPVRQHLLQIKSYDDDGDDGAKFHLRIFSQHAFGTHFLPYE